MPSLSTATTSDAALTTTSTTTRPIIEQPTIQYGAADGEANIEEQEHQAETTTLVPQDADLSDCEPPPPLLHDTEFPLKTTTTNIDLRAIGLYAFAFLTISVASGTVYGWPSLRRQLMKEEGSTLDEASFGIIYTCGSWATQACRFFFGLARDCEKRGGTKRTTCASLLCVAAGAMGIAMSGPNDAVALSVSMFFMGMGSGTQLCLQPVAGMFPNNTQGLLISTLSGAFQLAGLVFVALTAATTDRRAAFATFAFLMLVLTVVAAVILPHGNFTRMSPKEIETQELRIVHDDLQSLEQRSNDEDKVCADLADEELVDRSDNNVTENDVPAADAIVDCHRNIGENAQHLDKSVAVILRTAEYILLLVWFSISLVPLQYYIGTIGFQLDQRGDDSGTFTTLFSIIYAASAGVAPFLGKFADITGLGISQGLATMYVALSLFMLASTTISLEVHAVGMGFYSVGRMMIFGTYFTNVGKRFGYKNYGALSGLGLLTSGIVSLLQYPLIATATNGYHSAVDIGCGVAMIALLPYCLWLAMVERRNNS